MKVFFYTIAFTLTLLLTGCNDNSCYDNGSSLPLVRFYMSGKDANVSVSGVTLKGIGAPGDSIYASNETLNEAYLPLRATQKSTQWAITLNGTGGTTVNDTITLDYNTAPFFASAECGAMFTFDLTRAECTHNIIDSVVIIRKDVTNVKAENLRIYFRNNDMQPIE